MGESINLQPNGEELMRQEPGQDSVAVSGQGSCVKPGQDSVELLEQIKATFECGKVDVRAYSPLTLAYIGDAVYDLVIRTVVVERANRAANELHKRTVRYVNAGVQASMIEALSEELTEDEMAVYKRGRNAKSHTSAKNASIQDYRKATGFEALVGFLYITGQTGRMLYLIKTGIEKIELSI